MTGSIPVNEYKFVSPIGEFSPSKNQKPESSNQS